MIKLLSIISLILALVLFPPAALALISNNAIPGDATYPIKRTLENVVVAAASINPTTRAWFSKSRSDTRYKEFSALVAQGKKTTDTLNELVEQTNVAVGQIAQVTDPVEKAKLIDQLSQSIDKYDAGLQQFSNQSSEIIAQQPAAPQNIPAANQVTNTSAPAVKTTPAPSGIAATQPTNPAVPKATPVSKASTMPIPTVTPSPTPKPTVPTRSTPVPTVQPTQKPAEVVSTPTPVPNPSSEAEKQKQKEIDDARKRLEESRKQLEEERKKNSQSKDKDVEAPKANQGNSANQQDKSKSNDSNKASNLTPKNDTDKIKKEKQ